jgi:hypothetical protein
MRSHTAAALAPHEVERQGDNASRVRMAADRVRGGYPLVSGSAGLDLGMISHLRFLGSVSGLVLGLVFHPRIYNRYLK